MKKQTAKIHLKIIHRNTLWNVIQRGDFEIKERNIIQDT
jgi:hypothetical protein